MTESNHQAHRIPAGSRGFSLIEFMVAMVLGLIIIGGAISVYLASKRSYTEVEQVAELSENARFGLQVITDSLRHVRFFGGANSADIVAASLGTVSGDCSGLAAANNTVDSLLASRADGSGAAFGCVTDAEPGTDVLLIKSVLPQPMYDADPDDPNAPRDGTISFPQPLSNEEVYVIASPLSGRGELFQGVSSAPSVEEGGSVPFGVAWPYRLQVYYIRAPNAGSGNVPTLSRKVLGWDAGAGAVEIRTEDLVSGVEGMRLRFGFDSDADGEADSYDYAASVPNWESVVAIELFLLVRSVVGDVDYVDNKTYQLGDTAVTPGDNFRRLLVRSNVSLRNSKLEIRRGG
ncbi:PilW family protein [Parahaliea mediterranea]|uniref:PilW family protein n=1 Tax=Parahaliea mediterranea TaxID=651086 RepID=A0A939DDT0_9GAMM|nr:PilW family protein [Parahaliea mediterranea]MBN7795687.1 PilW family protein [Parahaliea mediterranea]